MSDKKYFDTLNNGKGLDHWSPSSSSMPLAKFNLNYGHHDGEERSMFPMQYKEVCFLCNTNLDLETWLITQLKEWNVKLYFIKTKP
jgi:hypothetical protein